MSDQPSLYESTRSIRDQVGWWLAYNGLTRNKVYEDERLRPRSMIVLDVEVLSGPRILGYTDETFRRTNELGVNSIFNLTHESFSNGPHGYPLDQMLIELVKLEGRDGMFILDFLTSLWPSQDWLDGDILRDHSLSIFSPFELEDTKILLGLAKLLRSSGFNHQREYESIHIERIIRGHIISYNLWDFEPGKGFAIKRNLTIKLLIIFWLPPFLVITSLCVLHLLYPDSGIGDILSVVAAALSGFAAWVPGSVLKGWQLNDAVRGVYYTTNLDTAQELSKSNFLKMVTWYPSLRKNRTVERAHLEPANLLVQAIRRGDAKVVGSGRCYFNLLNEQERFFSQLEIQCDRGVPLEVVILEPIGTLKIPLVGKGRSKAGAYIQTPSYLISEFKRESEAAVHLETSWPADLSRLEVLISRRSNPFKAYTKNNQLGGVIPPQNSIPRLIDQPLQWSRFGQSFSYDLGILMHALRGGKNLLLGGLPKPGDQMV